LVSAQDSRISPPTTEVLIETTDGIEVVATQYPANGDSLIIWVESSYTPSERFFRTAYALADRGHELWQIDFSQALFQPKSSNFLRNLDANYIAELITIAHKKTGKNIVLMARAYGAIPVLRGATLWQQQNNNKYNYLSGAILFSPDFYASIPDLGLDPNYLPIVSHSTVPLMIYQAGRRGTAWQFPRLLSELRKSNENIYFKVMPDVSGIFYRNDQDPATLEMLNRLPDELPGVIRLLHRTPATDVPSYRQDTKKHKATIDIELKPFKGDKVPKNFTLKDANGKTVSLGNVNNRVTIVNFWASWCPPCVEEIPSLNRLKTQMQDKPFRLISINYAEPEQIISDFLKRVNVEFTVLLDRDGEVSAQWNVIAFPSTFVIGPDGKIHYGINAAIAWDDPAVINKLDSLLKPQ
jgi:thiol-disulfide isomerase/thioredoxin